VSPRASGQCQVDALVVLSGEEVAAPTDVTQHPTLPRAAQPQRTPPGQS
jgi:hypothetical protein